MNFKLDTPLDNVAYQEFYHKATGTEGYLFFEKDTLKGVLFIDPSAHDSTINIGDFEQFFEFLGIQLRDEKLHFPTDEELKEYHELAIR